MPRAAYVWKEGEACLAPTDMPTYEYKCDACGNQFDQFQSITAAPLRKCPACRKLKLRRLIGAGAGLIFKGSGFYITDYRSDSYKSAASSDSGSASSAGTGKNGNNGKNGAAGGSSSNASAASTSSSTNTTAAKSTSKVPAASGKGK